MQLLKRNQRTISYKKFVSKAAITDTSGYETGSYTKTYGNLLTVRACVSEATGNAYTEMYGKKLGYDKQLIVPLNCDIDETSIIWIDASTSAAHDYEVVRIAKSLNHIVIQVRKVQ